MKGQAFSACQVVAPALLLAMGLAVPGLAVRTVALTDNPIVIRLPYRQPTTLTLPEAIAAVPTGADPATRSLELDGPRLFLQALDPNVRGRLFVVGLRGRIDSVAFRVRTPHDTEVVVVRPEPLRQPNPASGPEASAGLILRALLAVVLRGKAIAGVITAKDTHMLLETDELAIVTEHVDGASPYLAYAGRCNRTQVPLPLHLHTYDAPGIKAMAADTEIILQGDSNRISDLATRSAPLMPVFLLELFCWMRQHLSLRL